MVKYKSSENLDFVFMALANPTRRNILLRLKEGACVAQELADPFHISLPAVSKHLKVLEKAQLVNREVIGRHHVFSVSSQRLQEASNWVQMFESFWNEKLNNLDKFLNEENS